MQAIKDKITDMTSNHKAKSEARAEEKAEKDLAKAKMEIAHEVRLAKEAEADMDLHVAKADELAKREIAKHCTNNHSDNANNTGHRQERPVVHDNLNEHPNPRLN